MYVCVFTVEIVSLGHFLWVSFPVFMESGEEQHFLRGKPAFRAQTLFQAPQTGNALSSIYVFHPVRRKHECRKTGAHVIGCVSDITRSNARETKRWTNRRQTSPKRLRAQRWPGAAGVLPAATGLFSRRSRDKTARRGGPSSVNKPLH